MITPIIQIAGILNANEAIMIAKSKKPVILAGGLNPENVAQAIKETCPAGVDVHTGVENLNGLKSKLMVEAFIQNAKKAFEVR